MTTASTSTSRLPALAARGSSAGLTGAATALSLPARGLLRPGLRQSGQARANLMALPEQGR